MKKTAVLFPGQGSQYLGMAKEFLDTRAHARELMTMAEEVSAAPLGRLCLDGPMDELTRARNLQPALTVVNLICWDAVCAALPGLRPLYLAGHSLGEYSALYGAGVVGAVDCMRLVTRRGELMEREGDLHPGGMRAVLGLSIEAIETLLAAHEGPGRVTAANHNSAAQVVLSGDIAGLDAVGARCKEAGGKVIPLNVSVANHSPLVAGAVPDFEIFMAGIPFHAPHSPLLFNATAAEERDPGAIRAIMARQIASRVRWFESMQTLIAAGVEVVVEMGPKNVLSGLMRKILPKGTAVQCLQVDSPEGVERLVEALAS